MRLSRNNIKARADYLMDLIAEKSVALEGLSGEKIRVSSGKSGRHYLVKFEGGTEKYLRKSEMDLARKIVQGEYDERIVAAARSELVTLRALLNKYDKGTVEEIYDALAPARRELVEPILMPDDEFIRKWLDEPYEKAWFGPGEHGYCTSNQLLVRSKSEVIFADKYAEHSIPYKYEYPLYLEGFGTTRPDFTLLKIKYRRVIYHEHFGMMDDPEYAERAIRKIHAYEDNGYILGRDLIATFETKSDPIDASDAEMLIRRYLL